MATAKTYHSRQSHRFLPTDRSYHIATDSGYEFDESDLYSDSPDFRRKLRNGIKQSVRSSPVTTKKTIGSLPMNVPDWSKILREENRHSRRRSIENNDDGEDCIDGGRLPPHEYLARTRMASFSVHEGVGRTLKGRDLSRVRNAIFEKTGFLD
ncbi:hypothetical protein AALP_AA5G079000 [Arabis alpina]|uniref:Senescence regulator n=1 Tax=Arabis alpina TaxID=50452 RepID=A0A087GVM5_ARAAL|nr:hypothetical protein AALP_AA5G079000 [Arabis alpina]